MKTSNLAIDSWPDFQCVIIRTADYLVATELQACNDMIIMALQHLQQINPNTAAVIHITITSVSVCYG